MSGALQFNTDLFEFGTAERMVRHFQALLAAVADQPDQELSGLSMLSEQERPQVLVEWNQTQADYDCHLCVHELFELQVERTPDAIAVVYEDQQLSYGELNRRANQLAHCLRALGVGPEMLVGLLLERSLEMVVGLLGILKAGGAYVPLDPTYPQERLVYDADATRPTAANPVSLRVGPARAALRTRSCSMPTGPEITDESEHSRTFARGRPPRLRDLHLRLDRPAQGRDEHSRGDSNRLAVDAGSLSSLREDDRVLQKTPFSFDVSVWEFFWPLSRARVWWWPGLAATGTRATSPHLSANG